MKILLEKTMNTYTPESKSSETLKGGGRGKIVSNFMFSNCCYCSVEYILKVLELFVKNWLQN